MNFPRHVLDLVDEAVMRHPSDIDKAIEEAMAEAQKLDDYEKLLVSHFRHSIQTLVYAARGRFNQSLKQDAGLYHTRTKINPMDSEGVRKVYKSIFDMHIAGTILGDILGEDIPGLKAHEKAKAAGHTKNFDLLEWIESQKVPAKKRVRDAIPERKLAASHKRIFGESAGDDAE